MMFGRVFYTVLSAMTVITELRCEITTTLAPESVPLPQFDETLSQAERTLTESILSNAEINITYHGTSNVPLDDLDIELGNVALVHLSNLRLNSSPFHMISVTPHLRLMNLELNANISFLQVMGNYNISPEIMTYMSRELILTDEGTLNLTFHDVEISGIVGLNLNENHLYIHTVDLLYRPLSVVLTIRFKDGKGQEQIMEERRHNVRNSVEEPIYKDLSGRLNTVLQDQLNKILANVSVPEMLGNRNDTVVYFRTAANNHIGNLNEFVDAILNELKENITNEIDIPDIEKSFEKRINIMIFRGNFEAKRGWLKSLKTLHRTGDATLEKIDDGAEVSAALGLGTMQFGYNRYSAKLLRVGPSGSVRGSVGHNSVNLRGRVRYVNNSCVVTLEKLKVTDLSNVRITLTGLSPFNWIVSKVATFIVNKSKGNIIKNIEKIVGDKIRSQLKTFDCSTFFS